MKKYRHTINIGLIATLTILTVVMIIKVLTTTAWIDIQNYNGIIFTLVTLVALFLNKNVFTLLLGTTLLIGNFCGLSSFSAITTYSWTFNIGSLPIPLYWGQPEYSLMLLIYLIFNKGFFIGIGRKDYWANFLTRTNDLEMVFVTVNLSENDKQSKENTENTKLE